MAPTSKFRLGQWFWLTVCAPSNRSVTVARWFGSNRAPDPRPKQRVRLLMPRCDDPARAVILEGTAHKHLILREKRGGERVARIAGQGPPVEGEGQAFGAVDQAAAGGQARAHLNPSHSGRRALIAAMMSGGGSLVWAG